ncbi:amino acid adenylation domain-containing protein [Nonomuraea sp. PA05]|uniref:non-ribosomal peptide synthetase n=1 Tax=Nonomuraea sp. PA05 TaxID=2604466 RepID=UPI0011D91C87|nr:non-ribosomal peptide synthetase [Nonomuraea sp. PA05]TYB50569.1 amino acid adenylation domain-containing protein [Nonomuraea sp. PA05]
MRIETALPEPAGNAAKAFETRPDVVHERVRAQAARRPRATALIDGAEQVSYGVLDAASDAYAETLRELGIGPGTVVPVLLPRSAHLVAVLLAILKRGAAYAALDERWPDERLSALVRQCGPLLVTRRTATAWPARVWTPPRDALSEVAAAARPHTPITVTEDAACCVFFTSGTTGTPKGVVSPHRGTVRLFQDCAFADFGQDTVMPQAAPLPWDAFNLELWSTLMNGGTSVLVRGEHLLPGELREMVARHGVNTLWLTASLFNLYADEDVAAFTGVRQVMTGGERLSVAHVRRVLDHHPGLRLVNGYGPVESTIFATTHRITAEDCASGGQIPIGRPVAKTRVHVLDGDRPCPVGVQGELCVSGDGLALAYLGDPELTAEKFATVDLDGEPTRLYRTGDLGHRSADGLLHYSGRADRQVKIRGNRIEPAEIERAAGDVPGVTWCAAVPEAHDGAYRRMVLFYRLADGAALLPGDLSALLRAALPGYLVPDEVCEVRGVPLTSTGKLDQRALLALPQRTAGRRGTAARADTAELTGDAVAAVFADVLGMPGVRADLSFFAAGGTSLDAMRLCVRLESRFGTAVPVSQLFRTPDASSLAAWLDAAHAPAQDERIDPERVPLMPMQVGFLIKHLLDPQEVAGLCRLAWWFDEPPDEGALLGALRDVTARHEALRACYVVDETDGQPLALVDAHAPAVGQEREWLALPAEPDEEHAWRALEAALVHPLAIGDGRVWRAGLVRSADTGRTLLGLAVHHVAFDEWSQSVLCDDLSRAYRVRLGLAEPPAAPPPALWQVVAEYRRQRGQADLTAQRAYWRTALGGTPRLRVPAVPPGENAPASRSWTITAGELAVWDKTARAYGTTRFAVLLAAYADALHRVAGQPDLAIGTPVARRASRTLATALTCLIDTVCVRVRPAAAPDGESLITQVREAAGAALAAADVPFSEVVELVNPVRDGSGTPLYQAMFSLHDQEPVLELGGLAGAFRRPDPAEATCELVTGVWPRQDGGCVVHVARRQDRMPASFAWAAGERLVAILRSGPTALREGTN